MKPYFFLLPVTMSCDTCFGCLEGLYSFFLVYFYEDMSVFCILVSLVSSSIISSILSRNFYSSMHKSTTLSCAIVVEQVFIQSDVLEVALDMREKFDAFLDGLLHVEKINPGVLCNDEGWLLSNPMGIRTEREIHAEFEGAKIYRRLYRKRI